MLFVDFTSAFNTISPMKLIGIQNSSTVVELPRAVSSAPSWSHCTSMCADYTTNISHITHKDESSYWEEWTIMRVLRLLNINNTKELIVDSRKKEAKTQICIYISRAEVAQVNSFRLYFQRKLKAKFHSQIPVNFYWVAWLETSQITGHKGSIAGD